MARTKKISFTDSLAIWAETCPEEELRDGIVMLSIYARQRNLKFRIRIEPLVPVNKQFTLLDQEGK